MGILARWQGAFDLIGRLQGEDKRGEVVFPGQVMTVAVVDRLVHCATIFEINVEGYRLPSSPLRVSTSP
jgi:hypothetical protein